MAGNMYSGRPDPPVLGPSPGRPKGSMNKIGAQAKENIVEVFSRLGGVDKMVAWARRNKTEFYRMYARLVPNYVIAQIDIRDASELTDAELVNIIARAGGNGAAGTQTSDKIPDSVH